MANIRVQVDQIGPATSQGTVRDHHRVLIDRPLSKGGEDRGAMGGELLLVALGGCFASTLLAAIRAREADVANVRITVDGTLDGNPSRFTHAHMTIAADYRDEELMERLVTISERGCIVANTLRGAVELSFSIERNPVEA